MEIIQCVSAAIAFVSGAILIGSWFMECIKMNPDDMFPGDDE